MKFNLRLLSFSESFTDRLQIRELFLIIAVIFMVIEESAIYGNKYSSMLEVFSGFSGYLFLYYGSIIALSFGQRIESGYIGFIFSMPIRRKLFLGYTALSEIVILPTLIIIMALLIFYLHLFIVPLTTLVYAWFIMVSLFAIVVSFGKLFGSIFKNGLISFALTFGTIMLIADSSTHFSNNSFLQFFDGSGLNSFSMENVYMGLIFLVVSTLLIQISSLVLLNTNLKNGR